jgi:hypothetical protein
MREAAPPFAGPFDWAADEGVAQAALRDVLQSEAVARPKLGRTAVRWAGRPAAMVSARGTPISQLTACGYPTLTQKRSGRDGVGSGCL